MSIAFQLVAAQRGKIWTITTVVSVRHYLNSPLYLDINVEKLMDKLAQFSVQL